MDIDTLEALEAEFLSGGNVPRLGRECASYYWTQDGEAIYATVPLPNKVSPKDVSLALSEGEFRLSIVNQPEFPGIVGALGGNADPPGTEWEVVEDEMDGPALELRITKELKGLSTYWDCLLFGEKSHPTVQYAGTCPKTGVRFRQRKDLFEIEVDVPPTVSSDDISIDVELDSWRLEVKGTDISFETRFYGNVVPGETAWAIEGGEVGDKKTLDITLHKSRQGAPVHDSVHWWPRLSAV